MFARVRKHLGASGLAFRVWGRIEEQLMQRWGGGLGGRGGEGGGEQLLMQRWGMGICRGKGDGTTFVLICTVLSRILLLHSAPHKYPPYFRSAPRLPVSLFTDTSV